MKTRFKHIRSISLVALLFLFSPLNLDAQIAFAGNWNSTTSVPNVTTAASGSNRLLVYVITFEDDDNTNDVSSVTYGGQSMTQAVQSTTITTASSQSRVEIFYLNNAGIAAATHNTFIPVFSISNPTVSHGYYTFAATLSGVNQSTPVCSVGSGQRLTSNTVALSAGVSVLPSELLIYATHGGDSRTHTPSTGFTERFDLNGAAGGQSSTVNDDFIATAATINPTSTASGSQNRFVMALIRVLPAGATCSFALPIELTQFDVGIKEQQVKINWQTASETHNDFFTLQRSTDGEIWEDLAEIDGAGESRTTKNYTFYTPLPEPGLSYYRLKQTDYDRSISYSQIRELNYEPVFDSSIFLHPNPATSEVFISGQALDAGTIKVFNLFGEDITTQVNIQQKSFNQLSMDISELKSGSYFVSNALNFVKFIKI